VNCPVCNHDENDILEVRGDRRRRACRKCPHRWTTFEVAKERLERLERLERAVTDAMETTG
jgi:transcriptional regulator NrdR family protein